MHRTKCSEPLHYVQHAREREGRRCRFTSSASAAMSDFLFPDSDGGAALDPAFVASIDASTLDALDWTDELRRDPTLLPTYTAEEAAIEDESLAAIAACKGFRGAASHQPHMPASHDERGKRLRIEAPPRAARGSALVCVSAEQHEQRKRHAAALEAKASARAKAATESAQPAAPTTTPTPTSAAAAASAADDEAVDLRNSDNESGDEEDDDDDVTNLPFYRFEDHMPPERVVDYGARPRAPRIAWEALRTDCRDPYQLLSASHRQAVTDVGSGSPVDAVESLLWPLALLVGTDQRAIVLAASEARLSRDLEALGATRTNDPMPMTARPGDTSMSSRYVCHRLPERGIAGLYVVNVFDAQGAWTLYFYVHDDGGIGNGAV